MTNDGFERLLNLFVGDIQNIKYDLDGVEQTISSSSLTFSIKGDELEITGTIGDTISGLIDNFRIVGTTITYDIRENLTFTKASGKSVAFKIPYKLENKAVI